ncbi:MAG: GNAT family N-acetyltransferase [Chloroflexaceae bacterium]|nr:GNAT family N-acetyltransferase [Chloroflexaceae bacterium]
MPPIMISTARLHLRQLDLADLDALYAIWSDPQVMASYPAPYTYPQVQRLHKERCLDSYATHGWGLWGVVQRDTGTMIGDCGLLLQHVAGQPLIEIGYHLLPAYWGHGYAREAAAACRDYALDGVRAAQVISLVHPANLRSRRVAERIHQTMQMCWWERIQQEVCLYSTQRADGHAPVGSP